MQSELTSNLLACAEAYGKARNYELSTVGRVAAQQDSEFFIRCQDGTCNFTVRKYDAVMAWFSANWPEGTAWPKRVPRPGPAARATA